MPGLFDCHTHLQLDPYSGISFTTTRKYLEDGPMYKRMSLHALKLLDAGITTARDLASRGTLAMTLRDSIARGELMGPRLQVTEAPITVPGGHVYSMGGVAQGVDAVRAMVRKRAGEGADLIKVMSTGGFMTPGSHPAVARHSLEELEAIVDEAGKCGLQITTHATGTEGIERAVDAKLISIEHCAWLYGDKATFDERVAKKIVDAGMAMNTTCVEDPYFYPWDSRHAVVGNLSLLRQSGAKMIIGTDSGIGFCPFERYADGPIVLSDAGYTTLEIIAGATDVAAEVTGLGNVTGKLVPGLEADLAAFEGNPLEDVKAFGRPVYVMARGREHVLTPIPEAKATEETARITGELIRKNAGLPMKDLNAVTVNTL